jgi:signal transduction histidine kinase
MKQLEKSSVRSRRNILFNPHLWIITIIIFALTFLYYSHIFFVDILDPRYDLLWCLVVFEFTNHINGSLFCIPLIYAAIIFGLRGIIITWLFSITIILPRILYLYITNNTSPIIINIVLLTIPLLVVLIVTLQRNWRQQERKALVEREEERQAYIEQIITTQEDERKRISREIHDDTTQRLWVLANQTQKLVTNKLHSIDPQVAAEMDMIKDTIVRISDDTRRLSLALRPGILDDLGLVPALRWLVDQLNCEGSIEAKVLVKGLNCQLNHESSTHLYRIVQEALSNAKRHSEATQVAVKLEFTQEIIRVTIQDNGKGFSFRDINELTKKGRLGLLGIQERVRLLGGTLKIDSKHGRGTTISVKIKI